MKCSRTSNNRKLLFVTFLIVSTMFIILTNYYNYLQTENKLSQGFYSDNTVFFTMNTEYSPIFRDVFIDGNHNFILFKEFGLNYDIRGIYYEGSVEEPQMKVGRFFSETDFYKKKRVAVVGQSILQNNKDIRTINLFGMDYEVIGILGLERPSQYDRMIFFNLDSIDDLDMGLWAIDGMSNINSRTAYELLENCVVENGGNIDIVEKETLGIVDMMRYEILNISALAAVFLLFITSSLYVSQLWFDSKKQEFAVAKLVGYRSSRYVIYIIVKEFMIVAMSGYLTSVLLILLMNLLGVSQLSFGMGAIASGFLMLLFCSFMVISPTLKFYDLKVYELLAGDS